MRFTPRLPELWPVAGEEKGMSWRKVFSRSHKRSVSGSTVESLDSSEGSRSISYSDSTRATTPEMPDVFDAPPVFQERSPLRQKQRLSLTPSVSAYHYDGNVSSLYPAPLVLRTRPSTSSSASSPTSSTASWSSGFASTHPALSPLPNSRPRSIFSQKEYEPTIHEEPDYIRLEDQDQLILTLTSKYPTGVAADLYVPVDVSMPQRSTFRRRPASMFANSKSRSFSSSMV